MSFYVRTGNAGTDPNYFIRDLGITILTSATFVELTEYNASAFSTGGFMPEELAGSQDLYDGIKDGYLEASTDGVTNNVAAADYYPLYPLSELLFNVPGGIDLSDSRLVIPIVVNPDGLTNPTPRKGELLYDDTDGYVEFYDGTQWIQLGAGGTAGGGANYLNDLLDVDLVTTVPFVGSLLGYDGYNWVPVEGETVYNKEIDELSNGTLYIGEALPGTTTATASWRIQRIIFTQAGNTEDVSITWADGNALFDNVWNDRLALSYS